MFPALVTSTLEICNPAARADFTARLRSASLKLRGPRDLAFNAVHTPYQAPQKYLDQYKNIQDPSRQAYAASATAMDEQIGRVVAALDQKDMLDNTLIIFQSDNGGTRDPLFAGAITDMSKVVLPPDNGPYRRQGHALRRRHRVVALAS